MLEYHDIFISHSHQDEQAVRKLVYQLRNWNFSVYVDFDDPALREDLTRKLADRLRDKIAHCYILLFAISKNTATSHWMPWELGLAHGTAGRLYLWPLSLDAEYAVAQQKSLKRYKIVDTQNPRDDLQRIVATARARSMSLATVGATREPAEGTVDTSPRFQNPSGSSEFMVPGPVELYWDWYNRLMDLWLQGCVNVKK